MKNTGVLALALAVLPGSVSAGHCYFQYKCGKITTSAFETSEAIVKAIDDDTSGTVTDKASWKLAHQPADTKFALQKTWYKKSTCASDSVINGAAAVTGFTVVPTDETLTGLTAVKTGAHHAFQDDSGQFATEGAVPIATNTEKVGRNGDLTTMLNAASYSDGTEKTLVNVYYDFGIDHTQKNFVDGSAAPKKGFVLGSSTKSDKSQTVQDPATSDTVTFTAAGYGTCMKLVASDPAATTAMDTVTKISDKADTTELASMYWGIEPGYYKAKDKVQTALAAVTKPTKNAVDIPVATHMHAYCDKKTQTLKVSYHKGVTAACDTTTDSTTAFTYMGVAPDANCFADYRLQHAECEGTNACMDTVFDVLTHFEAEKTAKTGKCEPYAAATKDKTEVLGLCGSGCLCGQTDKTKRAAADKLLLNTEANPCLAAGWTGKLGFAVQGLGRIGDNVTVQSVKALKAAMSSCKAGLATPSSDGYNDLLVADWAKTHGHGTARPAACTGKTEPSGALAQLSAPVFTVIAALAFAAF